MGWRRPCWLAPALVMQCMVWGCAGTDEVPVVEDAPIEQETIVSVAEVPLISEQFVSGLEVVRWSAEDTEGRVGRALAGLGDRWAVGGSVREAWERAGFRLLRVRQDELFGVMESLPPVRELEREWWGTRVQWRSIGATTGTYGRVWLDGERIDLDGDAARLLLRTWVSPSPEGARVRVDLCIARSPARDRRFFTETPDARALDEGSGAEVMASLRAEVSLADGEIVLITAERPGVVWRAPETITVDGEEFVARGGSGSPRGGVGYGPGAVRLGSIGEEMFMREDPRMGPLRTVIVLLGRAPEEFRMPMVR